MKNLSKHALTLALITGGVIGAGLIMANFNNVKLVKDAQSGFRGAL